MNAWTALSFAPCTSRRITAWDAFIAFAGAGLVTGRKVESEGGIFICARGSTHQRYQESIVAQEYRRWSMPQPLSKPHIVIREEKIYSLADAITVPSTVAQRSFVAMGIPAEKVHVIPYGVRLDQFTRTEDPPQNSFEILFAGQVSLRKGIPYLLQAFARLNHQNKSPTIVRAIPDDIRPLLSPLPTRNVPFTPPLTP